ncbi:MAG: tRNA (cytidine(34)-2'-O)-methyltransferase [Oscillospiraceae bacterium]|jgi:tRNA (cytidine/uridine-2'-O-)-methyltransferase|nr:tRNA (cytidine(34)-2'-O)-methyltransferase [Oscillospiraceae bacterium]
MLNVVLHEPEIPGNTGSIARTCAVTGSRLHLIEPLGFDISESAVKRAGLDYWRLLDLSVYQDWGAFLARNPGARLWLATTKAQRRHWDVSYSDGDYLIFGKETAGLPLPLIEEYPERCVRIPMLDVPEARSLNLSNSVSIVLYEALRQTLADFALS